MTTFTYLLEGAGVFVCLCSSYRYKHNKMTDTSTIGLTILGCCLVLLGSKLSSVLSQDVLWSETDLKNGEIYFVEPATNIMALTRGTLDIATMKVHTNGVTHYYLNLLSETNFGQVVAVRTETGRIVLQQFPPKAPIYSAEETPAK